MPPGARPATANCKPARAPSARLASLTSRNAQEQNTNFVQLGKELSGANFQPSRTLRAWLKSGGLRGFAPAPSFCTTFPIEQNFATFCSIGCGRRARSRLRAVAPRGVGGGWAILLGQPPFSLILLRKKLAVNTSRLCQQALSVFKLFLNFF